VPAPSKRAAALVKRGHAPSKRERAPSKRAAALVMRERRKCGFMAKIG